MEAKRRAARTARKRKTGGAAKNGARATPGRRNGNVEAAIQKAVSGSGTVAAGMVNLAKNTLVTAISGARDVGGEMGTAALAAVRGAIRLQADRGDLGTVAVTRSWARSKRPSDRGRARRNDARGRADRGDDSRRRRG